MIDQRLSHLAFPIFPFFFVPGRQRLLQCRVSALAVALESYFRISAVFQQDSGEYGLLVCCSSSARAARSNGAFSRISFNVKFQFGPALEAVLAGDDELRLSQAEIVLADLSFG